MISTTAHFPQFTPLEYLEWEAQQDIRYEFVAGKVRPLLDETSDRAIIVATNFSHPTPRAVAMYYLSGIRS